MTPKERESIKQMVRDKTGVGHAGSTNVVRLMEIKNSIDGDQVRAALYGLLEFVMRDADLGSVRYLDDLTKLLNTGGKGFDTARILIDGLDEDEV